MGAEWIVNECVRMPGISAGILAPTFDHAIKVCVEGESGILSILPDKSVVKFREKDKQLIFANGSVITLYSSEHQRQLAGPQFQRFWIDEPADLSHGMDAWKKLRPAVRLNSPDGTPARILITGTPAPTPLVVHLWELHERHPERYTLTKGKTTDNAANINESTVQELYEQYKNSRYLAQEMEGELILQAEGALWTRDTLFDCQIPWSAGMHFDDIIVSIDPAVSTDKHADETGIVVIGKKDNKAYVIADYSCRVSALDWSKMAFAIARRHNATKILYERNLAGPLIEDIMRKVLHETESSVKLVKVSARKSKLHRAEPVSALYQAGRVFHITDTPTQWRSLDKLEAQMTTWEPTDSKSPDRIDALVHGVDYLLVRNSGGAKVFSSRNSRFKR